MPNRNLYFFIGTVGEFIKVVPVMSELSKRGIGFHLISTGQHALIDADLFKISGIDRPDIILNGRYSGNSATALCVWFFETLARGAVRLRKELRQHSTDAILVVHGDTISTLMGALLGKLFGITVVNVEAGYRSFNFLQPFPEEITRYLISFLVDVHFCPNDDAVNNMAHRKGTKVNTHINTGIDSLHLALDARTQPPVDAIARDRYFLFILHRHENLINPSLIRDMVRGVITNTTNMKCIFIMHAPTRTVLRHLGLLSEIERSGSVSILDRLSYLDFVSVLQSSEFLITDGGGNQQECYYLGKPCLILRNVTEGKEGLGRNIVLCKGDVGVMHEFISHYRRYATSAVRPTVRPSVIIANVLADMMTMS